VISKNMSSYDARRPDRMQQLQGTRLASFTARSMAFCVDFLLAIVLLVVVLYSLAAIPGTGVVSHSDVVQGKLHVEFNFSDAYKLVVFIAYNALATYWGNGRSLGKWLLRIRVVSLVHERMTLWHSVERALGYGASFLEFGFGFLQYFIDPNRRTVHDRIAETIVVYDGRSKAKQIVPAAPVPGTLPPGAASSKRPREESSR
jgi:uncharacterized RDD family membrane protein YckC